MSSQQDSVEEAESHLPLRTGIESSKDSQRRTESPPRRIRCVANRRNSLQAWWLVMTIMLCFLLGSGPSARYSLSSSYGYASAASPVAVRRRDEEEKKLKSSSSKAPSNVKVQPSPEALTLNQILIKAGKRGLGGGLPGALAGVVQTLSLMWLRTIINYQSRYGTTFRQAFTTLNHDGGLPRFYRGLSFALFQAPMSRFVSTAANDGVESLLASLDRTKEWGPGKTTVVASFVVGTWRMALMPIDTCKTVLQVDSVEGFRNLMRRVKQGKIGLLYQGAFANAVSAILGHYPWFYTYNLLSKSEKVKALLRPNLVRNALTGFCASIISDTFVNFIRVIKTTKQSVGAKHTVSYMEAINMIVAADGLRGLFGRGLKTRLLANALQSVVFTIIWRGLAEHWGKSSADRHLQTDSLEEEKEEIEEIYGEELTK